MGRDAGACSTLQTSHGSKATRVTSTATMLKTRAKAGIWMIHTGDLDEVYEYMHYRV